MSFDQSQAIADQQKASFSFAQYAQEATTAPTDSVTVYLDGETAYEIDRLRQEHDRLVRESGHHEGHKSEPRGIADELPGADIPERIEALQAHIEKSGVKFYLRAVGEAERKVLGQRAVRENKAPKNASPEDSFVAEQQREDATLNAWIAAAVVKIERLSDGAVDDSKQTPEAISEIRRVLYDTEWDKIVELFNTLSFAAALFDRSVDAGFPGGTSDEG